MGYADVAATNTPWAKILLRSAQAAQRVGSNSRTPHNVITKPSVTVARKTPAAASANVNASVIDGGQHTQGLVNGDTQVVPTEPTLAYDGSQSSNAANYPGNAPVEATSAAQMWNLENDPTYQAAIASGQSAFNLDKMNALANLQNQQITAQRNLTQQNQQAEQSRRQLAGNFAARGMQGGQRGAYYRAQDQANAELIAAQTSTKDQLAALNQDFLSKYGTPTSDWTGTAMGQNYRNQAVQQALTALSNKYTGA